MINARFRGKWQLRCLLTWLVATKSANFDQPQRNEKRLKPLDFRRFKIAPGRTRTFNLLIKSQLLCQLSYRGLSLLL